MASALNKDAQPTNTRFNAARRTERDISEMLGLVKGILSDGRVTEEEASLLKGWISAHPDVVTQWPGNILSERLKRIFADGKVSEEERLDLAELLTQLAGGNAGLLADDNAATALPLDQPIPNIEFGTRTYVFTGKFAFGPRGECERMTALAGAKCDSDITQRTNYLVIGTFGSRDWIQTSYGRKIEKAVSLREKGQRISIICEDHWANNLPK